MVCCCCVAEVPAGQDPAGTGLNVHAYWVSTTPIGPWIQLPNTNAAQIAAGRSIRKFLSGNLDAPIPGFPALVTTPATSAPPPPGAAVADGYGVNDRATYAKFNTERYLLRVTLARLAAATTVAPLGAYAKAEDGSMAKAAAPQFSSAEYADVAKWQHVRASLDGEAAVEAGRDVGADGPGAWAARITPHLSKDLHPAAVLKSLTWPGAVAVCKRDMWSCVYVGFGLKRTNDLYFPPVTAVPAMQAEYAADASYAFAPAVEGAPAPRPPIAFQQDVSADPSPPLAVEDAPADEA